MLNLSTLYSLVDALELGICLLHIYSDAFWIEDPAHIPPTLCTIKFCFFSEILFFLFHFFWCSKTSKLLLQDLKPRLMNYYCSAAIAECYPRTKGFLWFWWVLVVNTSAIVLRRANCIWLVKRITNEAFHKRTKHKETWCHFVH